MSKTNYKTEYKYNRETLSSVPSTEQEETKYDKEVKTTKSEVGLADYEEQHNSKQKDMLVERVKLIYSEKAKLVKGEKLSSTRQLQLEVAERLLGPQAIAAEFSPQKSLSETNPDYTSEPNLRNPTKTKEQRILAAANRVNGMSGFAQNSSIESQLNQINKGGVLRSGDKVRVGGTQDKFDKMVFDKNSDLESFSFKRERNIKENLGHLNDWKEFLPKYEKVSSDCAEQIKTLEQQIELIKDGINVFARKGNHEKRNQIQIQIDRLRPSLVSSNENIAKANDRINTLATEIAKETKEIENYKKELDSKYSL